MEKFLLVSPKLFHFTPNILDFYGLTKEGNYTTYSIKVSPVKKARYIFFPIFSASIFQETPEKWSQGKNLYPTECFFFVFLFFAPQKIQKGRILKDDSKEPPPRPTPHLRLRKHSAFSQKHRRPWIQTATPI